MMKFRVQAAEISEEQGRVSEAGAPRGPAWLSWWGATQYFSRGRGGVGNNRDLQPASRRGGLGSCEMMYQDLMTRTAKSKL